MSITRSTFDRQIAHVGNVRHGVATGPFRVEFDAPVAEDDGATKIKQGSIVQLTATGFKLGVGASGVPCMSLKNVTDADVQTGVKGETFSAVGEHITAIPVTSGYELETTEFDTMDTYTVGAELTAGEDGKVKVANVGDTIIGYVSVAPAADYFGNTRIAFFAHFGGKKA